MIPAIVCFFSTPEVTAREKFEIRWVFSLLNPFGFVLVELFDDHKRGKIICVDASYH